MKLFSCLALLLGALVLGWLVRGSDTAAVGVQLAAIGPTGVVLVTALFLVSWAVEILAWALTFRARAPRAAWLGCLWLVNMVGEAMNVVMPFGALGGEPVKGLLLARYHGVGPRESTAPLLLMQVLLALSEAAFAALGLALAFVRGIVPAVLAMPLAGTAAVLCGASILAMTGLRRRWLQRALAWSGRRPRGQRYRALLDAAHEVERALFAFVDQGGRARATASLVFFYCNWMLGAGEVWLVLRLLGAPLDFVSCWLIETVVVLVRTLTFFVPAQLGSTEAATVFAVTALAGTTPVGLSLAVVRRLRELAWTALGLGVGGAYLLRGEPTRFTTRPNCVRRQAPR